MREPSAILDGAGISRSIAGSQGRAGFIMQALTKSEMNARSHPRLKFKLASVVEIGDWEMGSQARINLIRSPILTEPWFIPWAETEAVFEDR